MSLKFVGSSQEYLKVASDDLLEGATACSVIAWIYCETVASGEYHDIYVSRNSIGQVRCLFGAMNDGAPDEMHPRFAIRTVLGGYLDVEATDLNLSAGTWYLLAGTWDGSTLRVYRNGVVSTDTTGASGSSIQTGAVDTWINHVSTRYDDNTLAGIAVYDRALSADEILDVYNAKQAFDKGGCPTDYIACYPMDFAGDGVLGDFADGDYGGRDLAGGTPLTIGGSYGPEWVEDSPILVYGGEPIVYGREHPPWEDSGPIVFGRDVRLPFGDWVTLNRQTIDAGETLDVGVVAFAHAGIAEVEFTVTPGGGATYDGESVYVESATSMTYSSQTQAWAYHITLACNTFSAQNEFTVDAKIIGKDGGTRTVNTEANAGLEQLKFWANKSGGYSGTTKYVSAAGDNGNSGDDAEHPYATIGHAIDEIEDGGGNDLDNACIYLIGWNDWDDGTDHTGYQGRGQWCKIAAAPGQQTASCGIYYDSGYAGVFHQFALLDYYLFENISIVAASQTLIDYNDANATTYGTRFRMHNAADSEAAFVNCRFSGCGRYAGAGDQGTDTHPLHASDSYRTDLEHYIGCYFTEMDVPVSIQLSTVMRAVACEIEAISDDAFRGVPWVINTTVDDINCGASNNHPDLWEWKSYVTGSHRYKNLGLFQVRCTNLGGSNGHTVWVVEDTAESNAMSMCNVGCYFHQDSTSQSQLWRIDHNLSQLIVHNCTAKCDASWDSSTWNANPGWRTGACTLGYASGSGNWGELTTRTDDDTGVITVTGGHSFTVTSSVNVYWNWGNNARLGMTVTNISGSDITVDGGSGDVLPAATTEVRLQFVNTVTTMKQVSIKGNHWTRLRVGQYNVSQSDLLIDTADIDQNHYIDVGVQGFVWEELGTNTTDDDADGEAHFSEDGYPLAGDVLDERLTPVVAERDAEGIAFTAPAPLGAFATVYSPGKSIGQGIGGHGAIIGG